MMKKNNLKILDGPPYTTGTPHVGTFLNKILKDIFFRLYSEPTKKIAPGFDTHGLPIERAVEKKLNIFSIKEIKQFGEKKFRKECNSFVDKTILKMISEFKKLNLNFEWTKPLATKSKRYLKIEYDILKKLFDLGKIYLNEKILNFCPICESILANNEIEKGDKKINKYYILFKIGPGKKILVYTTTLWSLPLNKCIVYSSEIQYGYGFYQGEKIYASIFFLKEHASYFENNQIYPVKSIFSEVGDEYFSLWGQTKKKLIKTSTNEFNINPSTGTGFVHISPNSSEEDNLFYLSRNMPYKTKEVSISGEYSDITNPFYDKKIQNVQNDIMLEIKKMDVLFLTGLKDEKEDVCWRCKNGVFQNNFKQWFLKIEKEDILTSFRNTTWLFNNEGKLLEQNWLESAKDWCLSRNRLWGANLPIWYCKECKKYFSNSEYDNVFFKKNINCVFCSEEAKIIDEVADVWFDASIIFLMHKKKSFDLIIESKDQIRGWFYGLLVLGTYFLHDTPFKNVLMHGWVLDHKGRPMSKSLGNVVTIDQVLSLGKDGETLLRCFLLYKRVLSADIKFDLQKIQKESKKIVILENILKFISSYASINQINFFKLGVSNFVILDEDQTWIHKQLLELEKKSEKIEDPAMLFTKRMDFVIDIFSRTYLKYTKKKYWNTDKESDFIFLKDLAGRIIFLLKPFLPNKTEELIKKYNLLPLLILKKKISNSSKLFSFFLNLKEKLNTLKIAEGWKIKWCLEKTWVRSKKIRKYLLTPFIYEELNILKFKQIFSKRKISFLISKIKVDVSFRKTKRLQKMHFLNEFEREVQFRRKMLGMDDMKIIQLFIPKRIQKILSILDEQKKQKIKEKLRCVFIASNKFTKKWAFKYNDTQYFYFFKNKEE